MQKASLLHSFEAFSSLRKKNSILHSFPCISLLLLSQVTTSTYDLISIHSFHPILLFCCHSFPASGVFVATLRTNQTVFGWENGKHAEHDDDAGLPRVLRQHSLRHRDGAGGAFLFPGSCCWRRSRYLVEQGVTLTSQYMCVQRERERKGGERVGGKNKDYEPCMRNAVKWIATIWLSECAYVWIESVACPQSGWRVVLSSLSCFWSE